MQNKTRTKFMFLFLIILLLVAIAINISKGSVDVPVSNIIKSLLGKQELSKMESNILYKIRLPRVFAAILFGGALSISGYLLQTFFKNPIVGPFVLGISSGAKLFVGFFLLTSTTIPFIENSPFGLVLVSFLGSLISMALVMHYAKTAESVSTLIVMGIMIGYIASAGTNLMTTFASENQIASLYGWSLGTFSGVTWEMVKVSAIIILPSIFLVMLISKPLEGYLLGETYAKSMGINIKIFRMILIALSSILSATVTAFAGPISFVGLAVPHLTRLTMKSSNPKVLTPSIFLLGASFTLMADFIARTLFSPAELSLSTVTSFIGAPIVISLMSNRRKRI